MRRLPVFLLVESSKDMGEKSTANINQAITDLIVTLRQDPYALETMFVSIFVIDNQLHKILPLTPLEEVVLPTIGSSNADVINEGNVNEFNEIVKQELVKSTPLRKGDWKPLLFVFSESDRTNVIRYVEVSRFDRVAVFNSTNGSIYEVCYKQLSSFKELFCWTNYPIPPGVNIVL